MALALITFILAAGGIAAYAIYNWMKGKKAMNEFDLQFKILGNGVLGNDVVYYAAHEGVQVDTDRLRRAFMYAGNALATSGPWGVVVTLKALNKTKIYVKETDAWVSVWDPTRKVGGQTFTELGCVVIGPAMGALCHELAHLIEWRVNGKLDDDAPDAWKTNGVQKALDVYAGVLKSI
jgi:hypothetical protein